MALILNLSSRGGFQIDEAKNTYYPPISQRQAGFGQGFGFSSVSSNQSNQVALSTEPLGFFALDLIRHCDQRYWLGRDLRQWRCAVVSESFGLNQADPQTVAY
jgi:hypothetical protein